MISANLLGGCQGTTGPGSVDPDTGRAHGLDFPLLDMADFVTVHRALLAHLGIERLLAALGGSLGGMQVLQWALSYPEQLANAAIVAASSRSPRRTSPSPRSPDGRSWTIPTFTADATPSAASSHDSGCGPPG